MVINSDDELSLALKKNKGIPPSLQEVNVTFS